MCFSTRKEIRRMSDILDRIAADVAALNSKVDEVVTFIRANVNDPAALAAFADQIEADVAKLNDAMAPATTA